MAKRSAVGQIAEDIRDPGSEVAHRPDASGKIAPGDAQDADLFAQFEDELAEYETGAIRPPARRGPGRPKGSSRDTQALRKLMAARGYRDPLEFLGAVVSSDTKGLADALGVDERDKVLKVQVQAATQLAQYLHNRAPTQVQVTSEGARVLVIIGDGQAGGKAAGSDLGMSAIDLDDYQAVTAPAPSTSHDDPSHD